MKRISISTFMFWFFLLVFTDVALGQTVDSVGAGLVQTSAQEGLTNMRPEFYRKLNGPDSIKAGKFAEVQDAYRVALELVVRDSSLALDARRERIRLLRVDRNQRLRGLLDAYEQQKAIPTTELKGEKTEHLAK